MARLKEEAYGFVVKSILNVDKTGRFIKIQLISNTVINVYQGGIQSFCNCALNLNGVAVLILRN